MTMMNESKPKLVEYTFHFIDGGWNSEWATSAEEAYTQALAKGYRSEIDPHSFHQASQSEKEMLLSLFY